MDYLTPSYAAMSMSIARLCLEGLLKTYELTLASPEFAGEEYRAANPDDWKSIGVMARKFNAWLREMQHAAIAEVVAG